MGAKHRYIDRRDWARVTRRRSAGLVLPDGAFAHRLDILAIAAPSWGSLGEGADAWRIADEGWCWLGWMRPDLPWALTAMRDEKGAWVQWYFDIVSGMGCDADGRAWFEDCYLDVVALPDGRAVLLDADEMEDARRAGLVTPEEYAAAWRAARELLARFPAWIAPLREKTQALYDLFGAKPPFAEPEKGGFSVK